MEIPANTLEAWANVLSVIQEMCDDEQLVYRLALNLRNSITRITQGPTS